MYKILKYKWEERNKLFFSSDWHVFHDPQRWPVPIWKMEGYESLDEKTEDVKNKVNAKVLENDTLFFCGDGFLNATDEQCLEFLSGLNCQNIHYLFGNHSSNMYRLYKQEVQKQFGRDDIEVYPLLMGDVLFVGNHLEIRVGKQHIVMNHFPLRIWNKNNWRHGSPSWNLSGHSHGSDPQRLPEYPVGKGLDLGWSIKKDVWSFEEIADIMSTKTVETVDHHDNTTT